MTPLEILKINQTESDESRQRFALATSWLITASAPFR